jgi:two-component system sensor histidine kinase and response regulator WspE
MAGDLRRVFHTLKGAARAIGCVPIREVAAAIEDLFHGHDETATELSAEKTAADGALGWIDTILSALLEGREPPDSRPLTAYLQRVKSGGSDIGDCPLPTAEPQTGSPAETDLAPDARPAQESDGSADEVGGMEPPGFSWDEGFHGVAAEADAAADHEARPIGAGQADAGADGGAERGGHADSDTAAPDFSFVEIADGDRAPRAQSSGSGKVTEPPKSGDQHGARGRTSVAYQQLDRLQRLSGELIVAVGALNAQRGEIVGLSRLLNKTTQQLQRMVAEGGSREDAADSLRARLEQLNDIGDGLEALAEGHDRVDGRLQNLVDRLSDEVTQARLVPLSDLLDDYPRMVRDLGRELGKQVSIQVEGADNRIDRAVLEQLRNPLLHLVRNAIDHGIEAAEVRQRAGKPGGGRLYIEARQLGSMMRIRVADDGAGIDQDRLMRTVVNGGHTTAELWQAMNLEERMQFLFLPGLSTADHVSTTSGRGFGLDIVKSIIDAAGGQVAVHSEAARGTVFELRMPLSLSLTRCLLLVGGKHPLFGAQRYALPMNEVQRVHRLNPENLREVQGRLAIRVDDATLPIHRLDALLGLSPLHQDMARKHLVLLGDADGQFGLVVDEISDELNLVSRPLDERLGKVREIDALALLDDGGLALILDVPDLLQHMRDAPGWASNATSTLAARTDASRAELPADLRGALSPAGAALTDDDTTAPPHLLVVEDSATVREVERHFLEQAGYRVSTAVNGMDGLNKARGGDFAMLITDIDMPRMNGIELIGTLRGMDRFRGLPIVVVSYKDRAEDREKAMEAGADRYVTKSQFDTDVMLGMVAELLAAR